MSSGQNSSQIYSAIMHFFEEHNLNMHNIYIVAQSYDGARVMSGNLNGVQAKVLKQYPAAKYTHCMAHRLNLVVLDVCKAIKVIFSNILINFKNYYQYRNHVCRVHKAYSIY